MISWTPLKEFPQIEDATDEDLLDAYAFVYELAKIAYECDAMKREITPGEIIDRCFEAARAIIAAAKRREDGKQ